MKLLGLAEAASNRSPMLWVNGDPEGVVAFADAAELGVDQFDLVHAILMDEIGADVAGLELLIRTFQAQNALIVLCASEGEVPPEWLGNMVVGTVVMTSAKGGKLQLPHDVVDVTLD